MSIIDPYLKNLERLEKQLEQIAQRAVKENVDYIIFVITERQWALGQNSQGSEIGRYSYNTQQYAKDPYNKPRREKIKGEPYNLDWTGELFETLTVRAEQDSFSIFSTTGKAKFLESEFNTQLTKLTPENNKIINQEVILPYLYEYILENMLRV